MDDPWGEEQARLLHQALTRAGITLEQLWPFYLHLGGAAHRVEIEAYLHNSLKLPRDQRDLLAHAANVLIARLPPPQAPYSAELQHQDISCPSTRPHSGTGHTNTLSTPETASPPQEAPPTEPSA